MANLSDDQIWGGLSSNYQLSGRELGKPEYEQWLPYIREKGFEPYVGMIQAKQTPWSLSPSPGTGGGGGGGGGENVGEEWPTELYPKSSSFTGLPDYANDWVKNWLGKFSPQLSGGLSDSLRGMENPIALNEAERANLNYMANENLRPVISNLGARGVLNSSVSRDAIAKVLSDVENKSYDRAVTNQQNKIGNYQKAMALLESILGTSRQQMSSSDDQWAPYRDMMDYLAKMQLVQ